MTETDIVKAVYLVAMVGILVWFLYLCWDTSS